MSVGTVSAADMRTREMRIAPSVPVAFGVFVTYVVVFIGLSSTSGVNYSEWFASGGNAFRSAVVPLIGGSLVLITFLLWARWDWVFKDVARLPMYGIFTVAMAVFAIGIVVHLVGVTWASVSADLLAAILVAGILVGFAEETLFRGIILRALRTKLRAEAWVVLWSSLWFGFFHATNIVNGVAVGPALLQCVMAACSGVVLYAFRRARGLLVMGMVAHGLWDISTFLPPSSGAQFSNLGVQFVVLVVAVIAVIVMFRKDRSFAVAESGIQAV